MSKDHTSPYRAAQVSTRQQLSPGIAGPQPGSSCLLGPPDPNPAATGLRSVAERRKRGPSVPGQALAGCIHAIGTGPYGPFKLCTLIAGPPTPRIRHQKQ